LRLVALAAAALLSGCASDDQAADPGPASEITVTLDADGRGGDDPQVAPVTCPGGEASVCDAVAALPNDPTAPVPPRTACTEIFGGPDTLAITGTLRG
jgi:hypothetical protein